VTAMTWKNDGSKLVTGSLCGSVDLYNASMKTFILYGKFELNYVSPSQIVIKTLASGKKSVVKSNNYYEITKTPKIYQDRYAVAVTSETIIVGDLELEKCSEIMWRGSGNEKYDFSNPNVCMIFNAGELTLVEYGNNEPLGTCRTEHMKQHLISARLNYIGEKGTKTIAYLLDLQTICIQVNKKEFTPYKIFIYRYRFIEAK
jgi:intraflagellar transport protein 172